MKAIMISIKPKWVAKILNGIKTKEIRKLFPKNFRGWIYIYCTKGNKNECLIADLQPDKVYHPLTEKLHRGVYSIVEEKAIWNDCKKYILNGKVVARFWCDNVTEYINGGQWHDNDTFGSYDDYIKDNVLEQSCLTEEELFGYCEDLAFSAINISQLEIFDKPKELSEFRRTVFYTSCENCPYNNDKYACESFGNCHEYIPLTKAPQNFCYVEVEK